MTLPVKVQPVRHWMKRQLLIIAATYKEQIFKVLDESKTKVVYNSEWLSKLSFEDVLKLAAKYTVARMLERDDFQNVTAKVVLSVFMNSCTP